MGSEPGIYCFRDGARHTGEPFLPGYHGRRRHCCQCHWLWRRSKSGSSALACMFTNALCLRAGPTCIVQRQPRHLRLNLSQHILPNLLKLHKRNTFRLDVTCLTTGRYLAFSLSYDWGGNLGKIMSIQLWGRSRCKSRNSALRAL